MTGRGGAPPLRGVGAALAVTGALSGLTALVVSVARRCVVALAEGPAQTDDVVALAAATALSAVLAWWTLAWVLACAGPAARLLGRPWPVVEALGARVTPVLLRRAATACLGAALLGGVAAPAMAAPRGPSATPGRTATSAAAAAAPPSGTSTSTPATPPPDLAWPSQGAPWDVAAPTTSPAATSPSPVPPSPVPPTPVPPTPVPPTPDPPTPDPPTGASPTTTPPATAPAGGATSARPAPTATHVPRSTPVPGATPAPTATPTPTSTVRVRPGDTLWGIADRSLPAGASRAAVAQEWPRWWAANRTLLGADPDLLRPGQVLQAPTVRAR